MQHSILAATMLAWAWLLASSATGSRPATWAAIASTLLLQAGACSILALAWRRALSMSRSRGWPDRMAARAEKGYRMAMAYAAWGGAMVVATAATGGVGKVGLVAATIAFHLGAIPAGRLLIAAQFRLLREYEARGVVERSP